MEQSRRNFLKLCGAVGAGIGLASWVGESAGLQSTACAATGLSGLSWEEIRKTYFTLSEKYIYMNNSTMGPTLKPVQVRMAEVQAIFSAGCTLDDFVYQVLMKLGPMREKLRQVVNAHIGEKPNGKYVANVDSVTEGMSLVANGISFNAGDVILTTDHEHSGGRTMWELQRDRYKAKVVQIPLLIEGQKEDEWKQGLLNRFERALKTNHAKVLSFSWITTSTGHVLPAKELCSLAKKYGAISVIDAAQAFAILNIDMQDIDCDFLVMNGHKYLCGPIGSGFICIHPRQMEKFSSFYPTVVDENYYHPEAPANHLPHRKGGLAAYTNILPLYDALSFYQELGAATVYNRLSDIGQWLRAGLSNLANVEVITPSDPEISCVMTCFRVQGKKSEDVYQTLKKPYGIQVKHSTEGDPDNDGDYLVRVSPHYYNTQDELVALAKALCEIAESKGAYRSVFGDPPA